MGIEQHSSIQYNMATDITIYFLGDTSSSSSSASSIYNAIDSLKYYDLSHFDSFFWSSNDMYQHINDTKDKHRSKSWNKVANKLKFNNNNVEDPCGFTKYTNIVRKENTNVIKLPISYLWEIEDKELVGSCLGHISSLLSKLSSITLMSLTSKVQVLNFRARSIGQSASVGNNNDNEPYTVDYNLIGKGQIVSIADTGVDETSCYFYDQQKGLIQRSTLSDPFTDDSYRKIIQYSYNPNGGDQSDAYEGHGTHVCGTVGLYFISSFYY
jgi:subtilisin family serine protease